jgi:hypothetical protein
LTSSADQQSPWFRWNGVCIDCAPDDFENVIAFYGGMLDWPVLDKEPRWAMLGEVEGDLNLNVQVEDWYIPPVWPEEEAAQSKMMHFEIQVDDVEAAVARAIDLGAREAPRQPADRDAGKLRIMLDPAGHPFCIWS